MNTPLNDALKPCPFCGGEAEFERMGDPGQSCIVVCRSCSTRHESSDEGLQNGSSWNDRASTQESSAAQGAIDTAIADTVFMFIDRMNDVDPVDPADKIVSEFVATVMPHIDARIQCKQSDATAQPIDLTDDDVMELAEHHSIVGNLVCDERNREKVLSFARALLANTAQGKPTASITVMKVEEK